MALDIEALLAPIPGDDPSGSAVPVEVRQQLDEGRVELDPDAFPEDDPRRQETPRLADWGGIARLASQMLADTSKDLELAARLTEALVQREGFAGLRDGLGLLRAMIEQCWDRIRPQLDPDDPESV